MIKLIDIILENSSETLDNTVLCHIGGASGAGKTTLLNKIQKLYSNIITKDLDEIDDEACRLNGIQKSEWKDQDFINVNNLKQKLLDKFIIDNIDRKIVLGGFHTEDFCKLDVHTKNKFLLNTDAIESARRAYLRSQREESKYRRTMDQLPKDIDQAHKDISFFESDGYIKMSEKEILEFIKNNI
jgi:energy-coupling factor transporter ATP-binding protein EcfA2